MNGTRQSCTIHICSGHRDQRTASSIQPIKKENVQSCFIMYPCALNVISYCTAMPLSCICVHRMWSSNSCCSAGPKKIPPAKQVISLRGNSEGIYRHSTHRKWASKASRLWAWHHHGHHHICTHYTPMIQVGHMYKRVQVTNTTPVNLLQLHI